MANNLRWNADRVDLWIGDGGYSDGIQDACEGLEVDILHAKACGVQRVGANQLVGSSEPGAEVGSGIRGDFAQPPLPNLVWIWWKAQVLGEIRLHQHHHLSCHRHPSRHLLYSPGHLSPHRQVHHPPGIAHSSFFVYFSISISTSVHA